MRSQPRCFRLAALATTLLLLLAPAPLLRAQQGGAEGPAAVEPGDPPERVGRVAMIAGTVSFRTLDQPGWEPATQNFPVTSGQSYWTERGGRAVIEVGASSLALEPSSELDIDRLGDHALSATLAQGGVTLRLRDLAAGESVTLRTPRGTVTIGQRGSYRIEAGDTTHPTSVAVGSGAAQVFGDGVSLQVAAGETATLTGDGPFAGSVRAGLADATLAADATLPPPAIVPPAVLQMTGGEALLQDGVWEPSPEYGAVRYPPVAVDWVPYRAGHWAWMVPWGWTWVDQARWGFAPFHYGRWARIGPRWGWVPHAPGVRPLGRPVYAPALVSFFGAGPRVGWVPLGPREPYHPPYRASAGLQQRINLPYGAPPGDPPPGSPMGPGRGRDFINIGGATTVPPSTLTGSRPVRPVAQPVDPRLMSQMPPQAAPPVRPTQVTAGVSPGAARQLGLPPGLAGQRPAGFGPRPELRPPETPVPLRPAGGAVSLPPRAQPPLVAGPTGAGPGPGIPAPGAALLGGAALGGPALLGRPPGPPPAVVPGAVAPPRPPGSPPPGLPAVLSGPPPGAIAPPPAAFARPAQPMPPARPAAPGMPSVLSGPAPGAIVPPPPGAGLPPPRPAPPVMAPRVFAPPPQAAPPPRPFAAPPPMAAPAMAAPPPRVFAPPPQAAPPPRPFTAPPPMAAPAMAAPPPRVFAPPPAAPPPRAFAPPPVAAAPPTPRPMAPPPTMAAPPPRPMPAPAPRSCPPGRPAC